MSGQYREAPAGHAHLSTQDTLNSEREPEMNMPGMNPGTGSPPMDALTLALRLALFLGTAALAGTGLARPFTWSAGHRLAIFAWSAGAVSTAAALTSLQVVLHISVPLTVLHVVLALALPALLRWPKAAATDGAALTLLLLAESEPDHTGLALATDGLAVFGMIAGTAAAVPQLTGSAIRRTPLALASAAALASAGLGQAAISGLGFDRRLHDTGYGLLVVTLIVLPIVAAVLAMSVRARGFRAASAGILALAFVAWSALPALPHPAPLPTPGLPLLAHASDGTPLLVIPLRPGKNLVHFPDSAGDDLRVTPDNGPQARATPRAGAEGTWAEVNLPAGLSDLTIEHHGGTSTVPIDTGTEPPLPSAVGDDGPECASATLGSLVAGSRAPLTRCPSDALTPVDATALRQLIGYMASHGTPGITIAEDDSPRSQQAAQLVREAAAQAHIPAARAPDPSNALVDVAGWSRSARLLDDTAHNQATQPTFTAGVYLAPWLLHAPVVKTVPTSFLPLRFNPRAAQALLYSVTLKNAFDKEAPSTSGFDQWLTVRRETNQQLPTLYACAQVDVMPMSTNDTMPGMNMGTDMGGDYPGQWVSNGTIVPISGPLSP